MPAATPPIRPHPAKPHRTLQDAACSGQIVEVKCQLCHRKMAYLAHDLARVAGRDHPLHLPPFPCSRCGTSEFLNIRARTPMLEEYGRLVIRRPARVVQTWRNAMLGED